VCNAFELPQANHFDMSLEFCDPAGPLMRALLSLHEPTETDAAAPAEDEAADLS
jgi:hypothetical protein